MYLTRTFFSVHDQRIEHGLQRAFETALTGDAELQITFVSKIAAPARSHKVPLVISALPLAA